MGTQFFDQFTLLHFAVGIAVNLWGLPLLHWLIIHTVFEVIENTPVGIKFLNRHSRYPGGKPHADTLQNSLGDLFGAFVGWSLAEAATRASNKYGWYTPPQINK
jgi:hypothetical protein